MVLLPHGDCNGIAIAHTMQSMGVLRHVATGKSVLLAAHTVAGRAPTCAVPLTDHSASNNHASVFWSGDRWEVRDLGSRNGTSVNNVPVPLRANALLEGGAMVRFGCDGERWELVDAGAPVVGAIAAATGEIRTATDGLLALPDRDDVLVTVVMDAAGQWFVEPADGPRHAATNAEVLVLAGQTWELVVPPFSPAIATYEARPSPQLATLTLRFHVSQDEEHVRVEAVENGKVLSLGERTFFYMLLLLARARSREATSEAGSEAERGWIHVIDLTTDLAVDERNLNVMVHRVREAFARAGIDGAEGILERRSRQIRIGIGRIEEIKG
jgi:FHA domain-containing protein